MKKGYPISHGIEELDWLARLDSEPLLVCPAACYRIVLRAAGAEYAAWQNQACMGDHLRRLTLLAAFRESRDNGSA